MVDPLWFQLQYRGETYRLELKTDASIEDLQQSAEMLTGVSVSVQKLLAQRSGVSAAIMRTLRARATNTTTICDVGLCAGDRIVVVGPTATELEQVAASDRAWSDRSRPRKLHPSLLRGGAPRPTGTQTTQVFMRLEVNAGTSPSHPYYQKVIAYLERLSQDAGVIHVCRLHGYSVGILTELLPHEHPGLLGLNENMGQRISLRIRTDDGDGVRDYKTTRRVLLHELAHNEINDHPPEFKELNSRLNRELESFERSRAYGANRLSHETAFQSEYEESAEERRLVILAATEARLALIDREIDNGCGSHR